MRINDLQNIIDKYRSKSHEKSARKPRIELKIEHELAFAELETFLEKVNSQHERTTDTLSYEEFDLLKDIVTYRSNRLADNSQNTKTIPYPIDTLHKEIAAQISSEWSPPKTNKINIDLLIQFLFVQDDIATKTLSKFNLTTLFKKLTLTQKENFIQNYLNASTLSNEIFSSTISNLIDLCNFVSLLPKNSLIEFLRKTNFLNLYLDTSEKKYSQSLAALRKILNLHPNKGELLDLLNKELLNTFLDNEKNLDSIYDNYTQSMQVDDGIDNNEYAIRAIPAEESPEEIFLAEVVNGEQDVISDTECFDDAIGSVSDELPVAPTKNEAAPSTQPTFPVLDNIATDNNDYDTMLSYEEICRIIRDEEDLLKSSNTISPPQSLTSSDGMALSASIGDLKSLASSSISTQDLKRKAEDSLEKEQSSKKKQKPNDTMSSSISSNPNGLFKQNSKPATPTKGSLEDSICCINAALTQNKFLQAFYYIEKARKSIQHNFARNSSTYIELQERAMQALSIIENRNTLSIEMDEYKKMNDGRTLNTWLNSMIWMVLILVPKEVSLAQLECVESTYRELHQPVPSYTFSK